MKNLLILLLSVTCYSVALAQEKTFVVFGKVVDAQTKQPMVGASAYCQNTTQGTITNSEGLFYMRLPNGGYEMVVTYTGFEKKVMRISASQPATDTLLIELAKEDKSLSEVAVVASTEDPDGLNKYGKFFYENFIGNSDTTGKCTIQNPEVLHFYYSKKRNRLKIMAKEDLVVVNYTLGYKIRYQLDSFSYDYSSNISQYTGSPLFQEMDSTEEVKKQWKKNRAHTYLGSRLHFMRSFYDSSLKQEGFIIEKLNDDPTIVKSTFITNPYNEQDYLVDSGDVEVSWNGRYRISYDKVYPDKKFLEEYKLPATTRFQITVLDVSNGFVIEKNGYFYEQYDVINSGYWAWKKLSELLPYDYQYQ
ncbi:MULTISPECIES: carboxypeptidase-like regulatory domain-containing protein [Niastella]|uniref:Carboxypeptidase-like regulatory domain-containing protein n=1 Tax=Niastella soli TaxID=2821487 RepID=A0ABS3YQ46_9BACT|nr:carboxypeptidase-like regulatory domain-containing protein [Niastella soli]MBO9200024.1 carboxypeptidase-like regulatory domain-containing protein [Niastella soli]